MEIQDRLFSFAEHGRTIKMSTIQEKTLDCTLLSPLAGYMEAQIEKGNAFLFSGNDDASKQHDNESSQKEGSKYIV
jgi:hypothetical protein